MTCVKHLKHFDTKTIFRHYVTLELLKLGTPSSRELIDFMFDIATDEVDLVEKYGECPYHNAIGGMFAGLWHCFDASLSAALERQLDGLLPNGSKGEWNANSIFSAKSQGIMLSENGNKIYSIVCSHSLSLPEKIDLVIQCPRHSKKKRAADSVESSTKRQK